MDRLPMVGEIVEFDHFADGRVQATVAQLPKWAEDRDLTSEMRLGPRDGTCILMYNGNWYIADVADLREVPP